MIEIVLVDDHDIVRTGLGMMLLAEEDIVIVGEASNGQEALELAHQLHPDVIVMDVQMPEMNGIEATRRITEECPGCAVLALTIHEDEQYFHQMMQAGARGYVPKRAAPDDLIKAIRLVADGHIFLYASVAPMMHTPPSPGLDAITERETEVLTLIAEGLMNNDIAERLTISVRTVERHRENIMNKLDLHTRTDLVKFAIREGLIDLG